jgi:hypothetical protein
MNTKKLIQTAFVLSIITIVYNVAEGLVSVFFGISDESLALFGFGTDSFVEVISGVGIMHMVVRMKRAGINDVSSQDKFERQALKITGTAFYILTGGLVAGAILQVVSKSEPHTTVAGIVISIISLLTMFVLMRLKLETGKKLHSDAVIADANCTRTCFYLSFVLLFSSLAYELFSIGWFDTLGSLAIAWFAFSEGREAFEKSRSETLACHCSD